MKRIQISRATRIPLFFDLSILVDGREVCRLKYGGTKIIELPLQAELIQIGHRGAVSTPHELSGISDGDQLEIVRENARYPRPHYVMLPHTFQKVGTIPA